MQVEFRSSTFSNLNPSSDSVLALATGTYALTNCTFTGEPIASQDVLPNSIFPVGPYKAFSYKLIACKGMSAGVMME